MNRFTSFVACAGRPRRLPHRTLPGSSSALGASQPGLSSGLYGTPRCFSRGSFARAVPQPWSFFPQLCPCLDPSRPLHGVSNITVPDRQSRGKIKEQPLQPRPHHLGLLAWRRECSVLTSPCGCPGGMRFPAFLALGSHGLSYSEGCRGSTPEL